MATNYADQINAAYDAANEAQAIAEWEQQQEEADREKDHLSEPQG